MSILNGRSSRLVVRRLSAAVVATALVLITGCGPQSEEHRDSAEGHDRAAALGAEWDAYQPKIAKASPEAAKLMQGFRYPAGFEVSLFAAEPLLANPVAFSVDGPGRFLVAETFRQEDFGVPDNRSFPEWLGDDIAARTIEDRRAYYLKHHPEVASTWTKEQDRIRLVEDTTGNGRANRSIVFAGGFNDLLDGTGAGLLRIGRTVFYTCIPNLWKLTDADGDGRAERRESVAKGFGVRTALRGHDCHGLIRGPDGRVYFSIGDRGYNLPEQGFVSPGSGAVFRCEPDGSGLQVFATGLRNPQELAFDDHGNLITGDNNSDSDDKARVVYVVEGAEIGWRMSFQSLPKRGPWVREGWWKPRFDGQATFLIPPVANLGNGPSGLVCYPGTGFPEKYRNWFFLCDFVGTRSADSGGVRAFELKVDGGGLALVQDEMFIKGILPTDCDFGFDGALYVSDFSHGWVGEGKGRLYRFRSPENEASAQGVSELLDADFTQVSLGFLRGLLGHPDRRVRLAAQFALAERGGAGERMLVHAAQSGASLLERLHGIWGIGQIARGRGEALRQLLPLLSDPATEVRVQMAKVIGDAGWAPGREAVERLTADASLRVRAHAGIALGNIGRASPDGGAEASLPALMEMARANANKDLYVRHAAIVGVARLALLKPRLLDRWLKDPSDAVRLVCVLALRRLADERIAVTDHPALKGRVSVDLHLADALTDRVVSVRQAAARAIYDVPIPALYPNLARTLTDAAPEDVPLLRRAIGANDLLNDAESVARLARAAADSRMPEEMRVLAMRAIKSWDAPPARDLVLNEHRPRGTRQRDDARAALTASVAELLAAPAGVRRHAIDAIGRFEISGQDAALDRFVRDGEEPLGIRVASLAALTALRSKTLRSTAEFALAQKEGRLRAAAANALAVVDPAEAVAVIVASLERGDVIESQLGFETLAKVASPAADEVLAGWMQKLTRDEIPSPLMLDVLEAANARATGGAGSLGTLVEEYLTALPPRTEVGAFRFCLDGGDAASGRRVFLESEASCRRCHSIDGGNELLAGPDLSGVGAKRTREEILHSILDPNAVIVDGYANELLEMRDGTLYDGRVLKEENGKLLLEINETGEPERISVSSADVVFRKQGKSGMPTDVSNKLSRRQLRDLVAFLSTLDRPEKQAQSGAHGGPK